jgi:arginine exporter protein ArgO
MPDVNLVAVLVATVAAFALSATYYMLLGDQLATVSETAAASEQPPPWTIAAELLRTLLVVAVVAGLVVRLGTDAWTDAVPLALALWLGFPLVLWAGAMLHERAPWKLAAIHAGDWLLKLVVVTAIVSVWQ